MFSLQTVQSFETFFRDQYPRFCYHAFRVIGNNEMAEDIVQEAFTGLWEKREEFTEESAAKAWMYTVVRHKALNQIRHQKVIAKSLPQLGGEEVDDQNRLNDLIKAEVLGQIHRAIESLPEGCRNIFKLAYFEGLKNQEIADELDLSINTIKTQKARALQLLRLRIDPSILAVFLSCLYFRDFSIN